MLIRFITYSIINLNNIFMDNKFFPILLTMILFFTVSIPTDAKSNNPPGTVEVNDNFYVDITEISNISYREYLFWLKSQYGQDSQEYNNALPDTSVWQPNTPMESLYLRHPKYRDYPVVGVTHNQAKDYCNWRSYRVNEVMFMRDNNIKYEDIEELSNYEIPQVVKYRFPTREEWEMIANIGFSKRTERRINRETRRGAKLYNLSFEQNDSEIDEDITATGKSFFPNKIGVYYLIGNVAEMIDEFGVAKGGAWIHNADDVNVEKDFHYEKPKKWLGFRCVCEKLL